MTAMAAPRAASRPDGQHVPGAADEDVTKGLAPYAVPGAAAADQVGHVVKLSTALDAIDPNRIVPAGRLPDLGAPHERDHLGG
jgi:hypothetical protein